MNERLTIQTIDPVLYSTFIDGSEYEEGIGITVDELGYVYVTGSTSSPDFPITKNHVDTYSADKDCFVLKLTPDGSDLLYSTYLSGNERDEGQKIAVDTEGNMIIAGITESTNFPRVNAIDDTFNGGHDDVFLTKLSANGQKILFSTFLGGSDTDYISDLYLTSDNDIIISGGTHSSDFPVVNALNDTFNGQTDCFITKIAADGSEIIFSTYLGGSRYDEYPFITLDDEENIYITGGTSSDNFPTTTDAYNQTFAGPAGFFNDIFVSKLSSDGSTLLYSTYIGGNLNDRGNAIILDEEKNIYVSGTTLSTNFPLVNGYDNTTNGSFDTFVLRLNASGSTIDYSTLIGGNSIDNNKLLSFDKHENIILSGSTDSDDLPVTPDAYDISSDSNWDLFICNLTNNCSELNYLTYFGGESYDSFGGLCLDNYGNLYITGYTFSNFFPLTTTALNTTGEFFITIFNQHGYLLSPPPITLPPVTPTPTTPMTNTTSPPTTLVIGSSIALVFSVLFSTLICLVVFFKNKE